MNEDIIRKQFKCVAEVLEREHINEPIGCFNEMLRRDDWVNLNVCAVGQLENGDVHYFSLTNDENTGHQMVYGGLECHQPEDSNGLFDAMSELLPQGTISALIHNDDKTEYQSTGYLISENTEIAVTAGWVKYEDTKDE